MTALDVVNSVFAAVSIFLGSILSIAVVASGIGSLFDAAGGRS